MKVMDILDNFWGEGNTKWRNSTGYANSDLVKCSICGKLVPFSETNVDHIIPQAIFKWTAAYMTDEEVEKYAEICRSPFNKTLTCCNCNFDKASSLDIPEYISDEQKEFVRTSLVQMEDLLFKYQKLLRSVLRKYNYKCLICGKTIGMKNVSLRRANEHGPRIIDNAISVCFDKKCQTIYKGNANYNFKTVKKNMFK